MDLIDRIELINSLKLLAKLAKFEDETRVSVILGIIETVKRQKTVDAVPAVYGEWLDIRPNEEWHQACMNCYCSKCGKKSYVGEEKYCPNCGTKMTGLYLKMERTTKIEEGVTE